MDRIIYVVPYISVIEQNAEIFREILGDENVLENHSNVDYENSEELRPMQLASENWDKPIAVISESAIFQNPCFRINHQNVEKYIILQIV